jgi:hypothetical protein
MILFALLSREQIEPGAVVSNGTIRNYGVNILIAFLGGFVYIVMMNP